MNWGCAKHSIRRFHVKNRFKFSEGNTCRKRSIPWTDFKQMKHASAVANEPALRAASRPSCSKQRWRLIREVN